MAPVKWSEQETPESGVERPAVRKADGERMGRSQDGETSRESRRSRRCRGRGRWPLRSAGRTRPACLSSRWHQRMKIRCWTDADAAGRQRASWVSQP
jgi:hypothetical protein